MLTRRRIPGIRLVLICGVAVGSGALGEAGPMRLSSSAFADGEPMPARHTCQGRDVSPPLSWSGVPAGTKSLVLVVDDPDAPGGSWVHWLVYNLPAGSSGLRADASGALPGGAAEGLNSWGRADYGGPCPPSGRHRYVFELYALDHRLVVDRPDRQSLQSVIAPHILARARLTAVYARH